MSNFCGLVSACRSIYIYLLWACRLGLFPFFIAVTWWTVLKCDDPQLAVSPCMLRTWSPTQCGESVHPWEYAKSIHYASNTNVFAHINTSSLCRILQREPMMLQYVRFSVDGRKLSERLNNTWNWIVKFLILRWLSVYRYCDTCS